MVSIPALANFDKQTDRPTDMTELQTDKPSHKRSYIIIRTRRTRKNAVILFLKKDDDER